MSLQLRESEKQLSSLLTDLEAEKTAKSQLEQHLKQATADIKDKSSSVQSLQQQNNAVKVTSVAEYRFGELIVLAFVNMY